MRLVALAVWCFTGVLALRTAAATGLPSDVAVFGEQPATFRDGVTPFPSSGSSWDYRADAFLPNPDDPITRLKFTHVPGLKNAPGRFTHRITSFGKYIVMGNGATQSVGGNSTDLRVGIFNAESKSYCDLILDPYDGALAQLVTGNPTGRKSRIIVAGGTRGDPNLPVLGYINADLGTDPCTTWTSAVFNATYLNAHSPVGEPLCPNNYCPFDGLGLITHESGPDDFGTDYVVLGGYVHPVAVARIDSSGITVLDTFIPPIMATPNSGGACYTPNSARLPSTDVRSANDWRALVSFDAFFAFPGAYPAQPPAQCAAPRMFCPLDDAGGGLSGAECPQSGACAQKYCAGSNGFTGGWVPCEQDYPNGCVFGLGANIGPCTNACLPNNPFLRCETEGGGGTHKACTTLPPQPPAEGCDESADEACVLTVPNIVFATQEYKFDKSTNTLSPTSPMFYASSAGGPTPINPKYDLEHSAWVQTATGDPGLYRTKTSTDNCTVDANTAVHVPTGEHCYYNPANPPTAVIVPVDQTVTIDKTATLPYQVMATQVGSVMYFADTGSLQYAQEYGGAWFPASPTSFKIGFAYAPPHIPLNDPVQSISHPTDPKRCSVSFLGCNTTPDCGQSGGTCVTAPNMRCSSSAQACTTTADCPAPQTCNLSLNSGLKFLEAGGSPMSLWVASGYSQGPPVSQTDVFLERVPLATYLADNLSAVRPTVAWDGDRLWLIAEHNGELKYRIRDDGQWSTNWGSLGPNNITPVGGAAVIANPTSVRIYARDSAGRVWEKTLASATNCAVGSCSWNTWTGLPNTVATIDDVAATFAGSTPIVAVRGSNEALFAIAGPNWTSATWTQIGVLMRTSNAPAVAYHSPDGRVWITARLKASGAVMYSRINPANLTQWDSWTGLPTAPVSSWTAGPAIASDGHAVRIFAADSTFPNSNWQTANDGSGWSGWKAGGGGSTRQPVATTINGEIELVSYWFTGGILEALVP